MIKIHQKVWLFNEHYRVTDKTVYEVTEITDNRNQFGREVIVTDTNGNKKTTHEYMLVVAPDTTKPEVQMIDEYLSANEVYPASVDKDNEDIVVDIRWGDWKHSHLWADDLMSYLGYVKISEDVTEDDGSDCYSADHTYKKAA